MIFTGIIKTARGTIKFIMTLQITIIIVNTIIKRANIFWIITHFRTPHYLHNQIFNI